MHTYQCVAFNMTTVLQYGNVAKRSYFLSRCSHNKIHLKHHCVLNERWNSCLENWYNSIGSQWFAPTWETCWRRTRLRIRLLEHLLNAVNDCPNNARSWIVFCERFGSFLEYRFQSLTKRAPISAKCNKYHLKQAQQSYKHKCAYVTLLEK